MQWTGGYAQFANHTFFLVEFQFPGFVVHCERAGKTNRSTIAAINTFYFLKMNPFIKRFTNNILLVEVFHTLLDIFFFPLKFKEQTSAFPRINFSFQNVDSDIVIFYKVVAKWFIATVGWEIQYKSFFNHY